MPFICKCQNIYNDKTFKFELYFDSYKSSYICNKYHQWFTNILQTFTSESRIKRKTVMNLSLKKSANLVTFILSEGFFFNISVLSL